MATALNIGINHQPRESMESEASLDPQGNAQGTGEDAALSPESAPALGGSRGVGTIGSQNLMRYGVGDVVMLGRPAYTSIPAEVVSNRATVVETPASVAPFEDPASWGDGDSYANSATAKSSVSGSSDSGGSADGSSQNDDFDGGDYGGGDYSNDDAGGGGMGEGEGGGAGGVEPGECPPATIVDGDGNPVNAENPVVVRDTHPNNSHGGSPNDYLGVDSYAIGDTPSENSGTGDSSTTPGETTPNGTGDGGPSNEGNQGDGASPYPASPPPGSIPEPTGADPGQGANSTPTDSGAPETEEEWLARIRNNPGRALTPEQLESRLREIDEQLARDIRVAELQEASLNGGTILTVGGTTNNNRPPSRISTNNGVENALNLGADLAGVLGDIQGLRGDLARLDRANIEGRINGYRQQLIDLGVPNVPRGFAENIGGPQGTISRDYGRTLDELERSYTNYLENERYRAQYGDNWRDLRIGRSNMTVQEFERQVFQRSQTAVDAAYQEGRRLIANGQLPLESGNVNLTLGNFIDRETRLAMRQFGAIEGIPDSMASQLMAVNRRMYGEDGRYGLPDIRLGDNTRNNLLLDYTLANKDPYTAQIRDWYASRPFTGVIIIRPTSLGGSYVISPHTVPTAPRLRGSS
jgi:hypothetical protein